MLTPALPFSLQGAGRFIPDDVSITAFLKPSGQRMQLLIRAPFAALNEIQFPVRGDAGYMDVDRAGSMLPGAARYWIANSLEVYENGEKLPRPEIVDARVSMPADHSFNSWQEALAHVKGPPLTGPVETYWNSAWFDILFEYPIHSDQSEFSIRPGLAHLGARVATSLKFLPPDGTERPFLFEGDPGLVRLNPGQADVARQFFGWGFGGVPGSTDYLLIACCLVLPVRRVRETAAVAAAFVSAGAVTLFCASAGMATDELWLQPLVQTLIAVTILIASAQNIAGGVRAGRRAIEALVFGLIYGFDFSSALARKLQFAGAHGTVAAVAFGAGTILSFFAVFLALPGILYAVLYFTKSPRVETIVLSVLAAHTSWHWMTERWSRLDRFPFRWPVVDTALLAMAMRWMMILVIFGGAVWFVSGWFAGAEDKGETRSTV